MTELAILGGPRTIPEGMLQPWPPIGEEDRRLVMESLESNQHTYGPNCRAFEQEFAQWVGGAQGIATNSGTAALHMAVAAVGCGAGDQVIVPAYSWSSSATCVIHHNCIPVFVDMEWQTMNMDAQAVEAAVTPKTRAIMAVHLHGLPCDMDALRDVARRHDLALIEDACQAHGARHGGRRVGAIGDCGAFSFNQNKCLCSGEGGMFVCSDAEIADRARMVWSFGESRKPSEDRDYHAYALGWMYRMNDLTAAFGRAQLGRLDGYVDTQRRHARILLEGLAGIPGLILPVEPEGSDHNWYNFTCRIDMDALGRSEPAARFRDAVMKALQAEGVGVGVWQRFILPAMTVFQARNAYGKGSPWSTTGNEDVVYEPGEFPVAQRHADTHFGLTFPLRDPNTDEAARLIVEAYTKVFERASDLDAEGILEG